MRALQYKNCIQRFFFISINNEFEAKHNIDVSFSYDDVSICGDFVDVSKTRQILYSTDDSDDIEPADDVYSN